MPAASDTQTGSFRSPSTRLERIVATFENAWRHGQQPAIDDFLSGIADGRLIVLVELVHADLECRLKAGQDARVESYLQRYPELTRDREAVLELIAAEYRLRQRHQPDLRSEEYHERFPEYAPDLSTFLQELPAPQALRTVEEQLRGPREEPGPSFPAVPGYEVLGELGRGGMGVVYKARQVGLKRLVALKMLREVALAGPQERARFRAEAEAVARFQHPHIVQIHEVGVYDGRPFFSLEFVDGGSLAGRLGGTPLPAGEAAGLVEQLARAMHYAHQRGVVHRDLTPANVLLSFSRSPPASAEAAGGERLNGAVPKITDFGLAKRLDAPQGQTHSGVIMGTPPYMAPEQAAGKAGQISPLTDVYALGAVLYETLTGRPPFKAETHLDTILQVLSQEPVAPSRLNPKVPRDLETICLKCLQKEPAKRYASAEELADDLRRFGQNKPIRARPVGRVGRLWRWCRRQPVLAGLIAALVLVFLAGFAGVTWQWRRAEEQSRRAQDSIQETFDTVDHYFTRVSEEELLEVPGMQPLRQKLLEDAVAYYRQFLGQWQETRADPGFLARLARAHHRVAQIIEAVGPAGDALEPYQKAAAIQEGLVRDHPSEREYQKDLARTYARLGSLLGSKLRQPPRGLPWLKQASDMQHKLVNDDPNDHAARRDLANTCTSLGVLTSGERPAEALPLFREALRLRQALADADSKDLRAKRDLAQSYNNVGVLLEKHLRRRKEALPFYEQARGLRQELHAARPHSILYQQDLALSHFNIANLFRQEGQLDEALRSYDQAVALRRRLAEASPKVPHYRFDLARTYLNIGVTLQMRPGPLAHTLRAYEQASALYEQLVREPTSVPDYKSELALSYVNIGHLKRQTGQTAEALMFHERARRLREELDRNKPDFLTYRQELARSYRHLGVLQGETGRHEEGLRSLGHARQLHEELIQRNFNVGESRHDLAVTVHQTGVLQRAMGRDGDALASQETARRLLESPASGRSPAAARLDLALTYQQIGLLARARHQPEEALRDLEKALEVLKKLPARQAQNRGPRAALARSYYHLAVLRLDTGEPARALASLAAAEKIQTQLARDYPDVLDYQSDAGDTQRARGEALAMLERPDEAAVALRRAVEYQEPVVAKAPLVVRYRQSLSQSRRARERLKAREPAAAGGGSSGASGG
jgi:serine/threonine protein kinase/tetratricopeptide (TPR) repeat protein